MKKGDLIDYLNQFDDGDEITIESLIFLYGEQEEESHG